MIVVGGAFERGNMIPSLIFSFCWATVVYCPLACWTWNSNGWLYNLPSLDFAGGGPVHIASGWSALAYAFVLGKRKHIDQPSNAKPHNTTLVFLGTALIWVGWLGFNVGHTHLCRFSEPRTDSFRVALLSMPACAPCWQSSIPTRQHAPAYLGGC